jgi:hypothetical protein
METQEKLDALDRASQSMYCVVYYRCDTETNYCYECDKNLSCEKEEGQDYRTLLLIMGEMGKNE